MSYAALAPVVEDIAPAPSVFQDEQAHVDVCIASAPAVTYAASASSSAPTPDTDFEEWTAQLRSIIREPAAERMRLQQQAQEASADRAAAELLAEEAAASPIAEKGKEGQTQEVSCGRCTRWQPPAWGGK